jgi:hypothetical protein
MKAVVLALSLARVAGAGSQPILVVPLEGDRKDVRPLQKKLTKALKKQGRRPTLSTRTMAELQEAAACSEDSPACLTAVGQQTGADEFVFGSVFRDRRMLRVLLRRFSVPAGHEVGRAQADLKRPSSSAIAKLVKTLMRNVPAGATPDAPPAPSPLLGALEVQSAISDVLIRINGQPRGMAPLRLDDIGLATYDIEAEKDGYRTWRGQATVEAGKVTTVTVALDPLPASQRVRARAAGEPTGLSTRTWVAGAVTAALLTGAAVFGALTLSAQNDFDADVEELNAGDPMANERAMELDNRADSGKQKALIANVLFVAAGAAAAATGVFVVLDLTSDSGDAPTSLVASPTGVTVRF